MGQRDKGVRDGSTDESFRAFRYGLRRRLSSAAALLFQLSGLTAAARRPAAAPAVLTYHRVSDDERPLCTPRRLFERQMVHLARHYHLPSLEEFLAALEGGRPLPRRSVVVTFDDGYRDALTTALPIVEAQGIPAIFFVTTSFADGSRAPWWEVVAEAMSVAGRRWNVDLAGCPVTFPVHSREGKEFAFREVTLWLRRQGIEKRREMVTEIAAAAGIPPVPPSGMVMDWEDLRRLKGSKVRIGCHGHEHRDYVHSDVEVVLEDMREAKSLFEKELGLTNLPLAFPYGGPPPDMALRALIRDEGFSCAFTHTLGRSAATGDVPTDVYALGRRGVESEGFSHFAAKVAGVKSFFPW